MENIQGLTQLLQVPRDIVITTHRNPDGDAIGSSLALTLLLEKQGHSVHIISPSEFPESLHFLHGSDDILIWDNEPEVCQGYLKKAEIIFCLDFNSLDRIDKVGECIQGLNVPIVLIDHHLFPEPFAEYQLSRTDASSTCELVFDFVGLMGWESLLEKDVGDCLYTGIITDTGSFKYGTSPHLFEVVSSLLELGVDDYHLQDLIFNSLQEKQLRLLGHCLANRMEILPEYHTGIIWLTKEDYAQFDIQRGDTEGIVNYLLKIRSVKMAVFITEQPTIVKLSLRSKGDFSVQEIARKHFKGGGHKNAAGGSSFKTLEITLQRLKEILRDYKSELQHS